MATVNKNFRVKNGLVVEGTTATVNGNNILTAGNTTDDITEGSSNLFFSDERVQDAVNALVSAGTHDNITVTYNDENNSLSFAVDQGLIPDTDSLSEGSTNLYFTDERAQDAINAAIAAGTHENITITYDDASNTLSFVAENGVADSTTDDLTEGVTNLYFTNQRALDATAAAYDAAGSAATAESNANSYTDGRETAITSAYQSYADTAEADANSYTDSLIGDVTVDGTGGNTVTDRIASAVAGLVDAAPGTLDTLNELAAALGDDPNFATTVATDIGTKVSKAGDTMTGDLSLAQDPTQNLHAATKQYVDAAEAAANSYADQAEADAITSANSYTDGRETAITTAYQSYADTAESDAVATAAADATSKANTAESNANTYTDNAINALDTDDIEEGVTNQYFTDTRAKVSAANLLTNATQTNISITGDENGLTITAENGVADSTTDDLTEGSSNLYFTDARAVAALEAVTPTFTEVDVNSLALQVASTVSVATQNTTGTVYSFDTGTYTSAKFIVKADTGTHTEVVEVLLTLDSSNNIAITEYAIVNTGGSLMEVDATLNGTDVDVTATVVNDNTVVTATGTLIA